jgi:hypothetical protein
MISRSFLPLAIISVLLGIFMLWKPRVWLEMRSIFSYKNAEPSDAGMLVARFGGAGLIALGVYLLVEMFK